MISFIPWWVGTIVGALSLAGLNALKRTLDITTINLLIMSIPIIICNVGFWYGFRYAPKFTVCWFTGSCMTAVLGILLSVAVFDKVLHWNHWLGVSLALAGVFILGLSK